MLLVFIEEAECRLKQGLMLDPDLLDKLLEIETDMSVDASLRLRAAQVAVKGAS